MFSLYYLVVLTTIFAYRTEVGFVVATGGVPETGARRCRFFRSKPHSTIKKNNHRAFIPGPGRARYPT